jgi:hypothetical protein
VEFKGGILKVDKFMKSMTAYGSDMIKVADILKEAKKHSGNIQSETTKADKIVVNKIRRFHDIRDVYQLIG